MGDLRLVIHGMFILFERVDVTYVANYFFFFY